MDSAAISLLVARQLDPRILQDLKRYRAVAQVRARQPQPCKGRQETDRAILARREHRRRDQEPAAGGGQHWRLQCGLDVIINRP